MGNKQQNFQVRCFSEIGVRRMQFSLALIPLLKLKIPGQMAPLFHILACKAPSRKIKRATLYCWARNRLLSSVPRQSAGSKAISTIENFAPEVFRRRPMGPK